MCVKIEAASDIDGEARRLRSLAALNWKGSLTQVLIAAAAIHWWSFRRSSATRLDLARRARGGRPKAARRRWGRAGNLHPRASRPGDDHERRSCAAERDCCGSDLL